MYKHTCKECGKEFENKKRESSFCSRKCRINGVAKKNKKNLAGQKFGRLTAISSKIKNNKTYWNCICECGKLTSVQVSDLTRGITKSCGCLQKETIRNRGSLKSADISLLHKKFGMLEVVDFSGYKCICKCDCGNIITLYPSLLLKGHTKSCGCLKIISTSKRCREISQKNYRENTNIAKIASNRLSKNNSSGVKGVSKTKKGKYIAYIGFQNKSIYLGESWDIEKAIKLRKEAEKKYYKPILDKYQRN